MGKRVLILSASAGTGHLRAADALAKTFKATPGFDDVMNDDALVFSRNFIFKDIYSSLYTRLVRKAPTFVGWWYDRSDEPWQPSDDIRIMVDRLNTRPLVEFIKNFQPDLVVCTHFMPAGVIANLIRRKKLKTHLSIVVTDYDVHAMWLSKAFNRYFVAIDEAKEHLKALGLPDQRITVSGIPVDPVFAEPVDEADVRERYSLAPDKPTLLVSAGALGVSPTESVTKRLLQLTDQMQAVVICGKNEEMKQRVEKLVEHKGESFRVLGYTKEMHNLMKISDLFIGKPGGLTTSECMVCGLPMVIISPIPGQEDRNSDMLLERGCAIKCNEITILPYKVNRLLEQPERLARMRESALELGRPDAAHEIVGVLMNEIGMPSMKMPRRLRRKVAREAQDS